ncbi:SulP family inorganic anion transporter [uncultured Desulfovibrio sp.]|mgnify:CR=1 FL=1|uniref:SulP family inorganic anion transporter n=1 Tax=uncultured Desulfovibrio sp. TaxID=167968 RepID=UPI0003A2CA4D|nr:SulP family inorganic anion transporter [uncultured Desulfovibrio sp.]
MRARTPLPFLSTLQSYTREGLRADFTAAFTVTPKDISKAMTYAMMAGMHPQYGIYTCLLPVIVAALWGTSRILAAGPTNAISMILFSTMYTVSMGGVLLPGPPEEMRMPCIFGLAPLCDLIQVGMDLARLGDLANFHSLMVTFATGMVFLIAASQLKVALGLPGVQPVDFSPQVWLAMWQFGQTNWWSRLLAPQTIGLTWLFNLCISRRFPSTLAALAIATLTAMILDTQSKDVP